MKTKLAVGLLALALGGNLFADPNSRAEEGEGFLIGLNEAVSEKIFEVHHPGLVRWVEGGANQESYTVPGCFYVEAFDGRPELAERFFNSVEVLADRKVLDIEKVHGTMVYADLKVMPRYVGFYKMRTKNGGSFGSLAKEIFGDKATKVTYPVKIIFSRGCMDLNPPPFLDRVK